MSSSSDEVPVASIVVRVADAPRWSSDRLECTNHDPDFRVISRVSGDFRGVSRHIRHFSHIVRRMSGC